ncbi:MAG: imidazoleglycerol-phosphate dehydratase HisB [Opitutales bacterium]|jgi:imidazoleglycerol-phosphate dehydratase|nr:imidazoleglycerol-phosphate dehydratase HisB [Opitutales bacterium]MDG2253611.1 imidazoleglycerol-phosphate dehydratase HisB [Opitutaceae bacterium]MBT5168532.1 imidazoleglycerol-phosphate dehydratase HisB [Opitutales bacterium]MBT5815627.1 imidazoleglycerol-phosphate dehydratase HisB [Opitutales bacterium]MBT6379053.1 imidazoleglycerol-phosphate dehydratase HisB [Opitutales bacterium]
MAEERIASLERETKETNIRASLNVDGSGKSEIDTGVPFFDHMLTLFAAHGLFDLEVSASGDVDVDYHHTVEDVGIVLGQLFKDAIGDKKGMRRYGFFILPMDECLGRVAIDLGNRPFLEYQVVASTSYVRDFNIILVKEFCRAFSNTLGANLHVKLEYGEEPHHIAECIFKCMARAIDAASTIDDRLEGRLPSTKGML